MPRGSSRRARPAQSARRSPTRKAARSQSPYAIGFRDRGWLNFNGQPHSDRLHVVERMRRPDLGDLEIEITLDDPGAFQKKWTGTLYATLAPDIELQEFVCTENNKDPAHILGK